MEIIGKKERKISSVDDWEPPRDKKKQWVDGRSAKEIARAFLREGAPQLPAPLVALLHQEPALAAFDAYEARPEFETDLPPAGARGPRNHDVWIRGRIGDQIVCLGVEAKADEAFDGPLSAKMTYADKRTADGKATDMPERLDVLGDMLFGSSFDVKASAFSRVGYQLISGLAGTAIQAARDGASMAAFVIYEFVSNATNAKRHAQNATDLNAFVRLLPGDIEEVSDRLVGPITFEKSAHIPRSVKVFIGKVSEELK